MKNTFILFSSLLLSHSLQAQVEVNKPIQLTGGTGERFMTGLELPVNGSDATSKDYVDSAVSAGGGGSVLYTVGDGSTPTMMSATSPSGSLNMMNTIAYCRNLVEGGYTDWRVPTLDEVWYLLSSDALYPAITNPTENFYFSALANFGPGNSGVVGRFYLNLSNSDLGPISFTDTGSSWRARCVR